MASQVAMFFALSLLSAAAAHGCGSYCQPPVVVNPPPPPPVVVPAPHHHGGGGQQYTLRLRVCANVLGVVKLGAPAYDEFCPLLSGLVDLDAAVCLCTAVRAHVLGVRLNVPVGISLLLNHCGKKCPSDFTCPAY